MKICTSCKIVKDFSCFSKDSRLKSELRSKCKKCIKRKNQKYWKNKASSRIKPYRLAIRYRLTVEQWNSLFKSQNERCAVCFVEHPGKGGWQTDHDHTTNKIRGILCMACNIGLGIFKDDLHRLASAIEYLKSRTEGCDKANGLNECSVEV